MPQILFMSTSNFYFRSLFTPQLLLLMFVSVMFSSICLSIWNIPKGLHWFSYYGMGVPLACGQPIIFSWVKRTLAHDDMKRNFVVVITNTAAFVTAAWIPILTFNQTKAPEFHVGYTYNATLCGFGIIMTFVTWYFYNRDAARKSPLSSDKVVQDEVTKNESSVSIKELDV